MKDPLASFRIAATGDFGSARRLENIRRWIENNGGTYTSNITSDTTHLICSSEHFKKQVTLVRKAKAQKNVKIVRFDWLEDCLQKRARRKELPYLLGPETVNSRSNPGRTARAPQTAKDKLALMRQRREQLQAAFAGNSKHTDEKLLSEGYHIYRDMTQFDYGIVLLRVDKRAKCTEQIQLQLYESNTAPSVFATVIRYSLSPDDSADTSRMLAPPGSPYFNAFREFQKAFLAHTKVHWDERLGPLSKEKNLFIYSPPPTGLPRGLLPGSRVGSSVSRGADSQQDEVLERPKDADAKLQ